MFFTYTLRRALALLPCLIMGLAHGQETPTPAPASSAQVYQALSQALRSGNAALALQLAQSRLQTHPQDVQARFTEAAALGELGQTQQALASYERLTQRFPELPEPHNNMAVLLAQDQRLDEALVALQTAVKLNPAYGTAWRNLADVYTALARQATARAEANPTPQPVTRP